MKALLADLLRTRATAQAWAWAEKGLQAAQGQVDRNMVMGYHAGASRRMGKVALALSPAEVAKAQAKLAAGTLSHWGADEAYRALLLLMLDHLPPDAYVELVQAVYRQGDSREQESWLRGPAAARARPAAA